MFLLLYSEGDKIEGKLGKIYFNSTHALIVEIEPYFYNCSGYISMDFLIPKGSLTGLSSVWPLPKLWELPLILYFFFFSLLASIATISFEVSTILLKKYLIFLHRKVELVEEEVDSLKQSLDKHLLRNQKKTQEAKERAELLERAVCF